MNINAPTEAVETTPALRKFNIRVRDGIHASFSAPTLDVEAVDALDAIRFYNALSGANAKGHPWGPRELVIEEKK